jgi:putative transposase
LQNSLRLSDGTIYQPVSSFKTSQRKMTLLQRQLSRMVKFSANWQKWKRKIQRLQSQSVHMRRDYFHKITIEISKNHAMIVIEALKVSNLSESVRGTTEHAALACGGMVQSYRPLKQQPSPFRARRMTI